MTGWLDSDTPVYPIPYWESQRDLTEPGIISGFGPSRAGPLRYFHCCPGNMEQGQS